MRPLVMGVLNVTPDSFSDGGLYLDPERALERGLAMVAEGADLVDVGGESSRPGAEPVSEVEECRRVVPVIEALAPHVRVSVDTVKPGVAEAAVAAGATLVNDISATLWPVAAAHGVGWVAMHMQGTPATMQDDPRYGDVVGEIRSFLLARAREASRRRGGRGLDRSGHRIREDGATESVAAPPPPGTGRTGLPPPGGHQPQVLSRPLGPRCLTDDRRRWSRRLAGSLSTATWAMLAGAAMVRVHDVAATVQAATLVGETRLVPA